MGVDGAAVIVTGANRGLGRALVDAFLAANARKVYAAMRDPAAAAFGDPRAEPAPLDVNDERSVAALARRCGPVDILVNNAAVITKSPSLGAPDLDGARLEMETNYFGVLRMSRAFAPLLARAGGGMIVNILSIGALASVPSSGSYCASKAAAWSLTQSMRAELKGQNTRVAAVFAGPIATAMARPERAQGRCPPETMAAEIVSALQRGETTIFPDPRSRTLAQLYAGDPWALERAFAAQPG